MRVEGTRSDVQPDQGREVEGMLTLSVNRLGRTVNTSYLGKD